VLRPQQTDATLFIQCFHLSFAVSRQLLLCTEQSTVWTKHCSRWFCQPRIRWKFLWKCLTSSSSARRFPLTFAASQVAPAMAHYVRHMSSAPNREFVQDYGGAQAITW